MAFFNVGSLGGNVFATPVGRSIEHATDGALASENWALNMEICDLINTDTDTARDAMKAIRKRLSQNAGKNNQVIMYTLTVLETCVKNCGKPFHVLVAQRDFINELVKLIGPKNDPPACVQEKVLSLIQVWADTFKNQSDLNGVAQVYADLKHKGIEFPQTDLDTMAPIYTPQRSVPDTPAQPMAAPLPQTASVVSPHHMAAPAVQGNGPATLTPEQTAKLQAQLEIVAHNMAVLGEMLSELKPGQEDADDYALLQELTSTCKEMQSRIVELIGRIDDDELTAECLRLNDELNNIFLRHQRYEKNRSSTTGVAPVSATTSPSAVLGAALGLPPAEVARLPPSSNNGPPPSTTWDASKDPILIDLVERTDKLQTPIGWDLLGTSATKAPSHPATSVAADEFDMLAQSRTATETQQQTAIGGRAAGTDLLRDIPSMDVAAGSIATSASSPFKRPTDRPQQSVPAARELDEMEAWLGSAKGLDVEETLTSTEFDKFLEERAAAADNLPTIATTGANANSNSSSADNQHPKKTSKKPAVDENLLAL